MKFAFVLSDKMVVNMKIMAIRSDCLKLDFNYMVTHYTTHSQSCGHRPENIFLEDQYFTYRLADLLLMTDYHWQG
jgi:hypothetical protein